MTDPNAPAPRGRPSLFQDKYTEKLLEYFDREPYSEELKRIITKSGDVIEVPMDVASDFPTLAGFAVSIGVHRDTLHEWANAKAEDGELKYQDFSDAYKRAKDFQENFIATNGMRGLVNPAFAIFTAKNVLGWRDKHPGEEDKVVVNNFPKESLSDLKARAKAIAREIMDGDDSE